MKKILSMRDFANIKRMAQIVNPIVSKKQTCLNNIEKLNADIESYDQQIAGYEAGIKALCLGLGTEDLVVKKLIPNGVDKDGKAVSKTVYEAKPCIQFNEEKKYYVLTVGEEESAEQAPEEADETETQPAEEFNPFNV